MNFIISQGGCSSWAIMRWAGTPFPIMIDGFEYNAHGRDPNHISFLQNAHPIDKKKSYKENDRVLYVIANPYDYTIYCLNKVLGWTLSHVAQAQSDFEYFEKNKPNLIEYLRDPYDAFLYKEHAEGYLNNDSRKYDLMFIKYESLKDNDIMNRVKKFWNLSDSHPDFEFKQRSSNWMDCSEEIKELFDKIYGNLMKWYNSLPDYSILKSNG